MNENEFMEMVMTGNLDRCVKKYTTNIVKYNFQRLYSLLQQNNINLYIDSNKYLQKYSSRYCKLHLDCGNNVCNLLNIRIPKNINDTNDTNDIQNLFITLNLLYKNGFTINFNYKTIDSLLKPSYNIINAIDSIEIIFYYTYNDEAYFIVDAFNIPIIISFD